MKSFFLSIFLALGSLFGFHSQSLQPATTVDVTASTTPSTNQIASSTHPNSTGTPTFSTTIINVNTTSNTENVRSNSSSSPSNNFIRTLPIISRLPFSTTGWQTYQDGQSGIKFEYPSDWYLEHSTVPGVLATIQLTKDGYTLVIQACGSRCAAGASEQTYTQNIKLSPSAAVSLNIDGFQSWRTLNPISDSEDQIYFVFNFLRNVTTSTNQSDFNNTSLYTPTSISIGINGTFYSISYQLFAATTASDYDHSIINQMDKIVQTITLSPAKGF